MSWTVKCISDDIDAGKGTVVATWTDGVRTYTHSSRHSTDELNDPAAVAAWKSECEAQLALYNATEDVADNAASILTGILNGSN